MLNLTYMRKNVKNYIHNSQLTHTKHLTRCPLSNHIYSGLSSYQKTTQNYSIGNNRQTFQPILKYIPSNIWAAISSVLKYIFYSKHDFITSDKASQNSHYIVPDTLKIAIAGDWGAGTEEAFVVSNEMMKFDGSIPDITIHLGDIYYVGGKNEVCQNCLGGKDENGQQKFPAKDSVLWNSGSLGSFALNANHEMLANGTAYFDNFLPKLGMLNDKKEPQGQGTSFFCLENNFWRILAIDTGYNSAGLLSGKPETLCKLEDSHIEWIKSLIPENDTKATILLSHHQYFSAFEDNYTLPSKQLSEIFKVPIIWLWGHEHRASGYDLFNMENISLQAYGRCIGNGGMPVDALEPSTDPLHILQNNKLIYYDARINPIYAGGGQIPPVGINGYSHFLFDGPKLSIKHKFLVCDGSEFNNPSYPTSETLITEMFTCSGSSIQWVGLQGPTLPIKGFNIKTNLHFTTSVV